MAKTKGATASKKSTIRCAVIGYGGAFNMGKHHADAMRAAPGFEVVAACDIDPARMEAASADFPGIETYTDPAKMLAKADFDLVAVVTPHNTHADLAVRAAKAGKHVVVEKPMCISVKEADAMIAAAEKAGTVLTVFQNRRHDGDFLALKEIVEKGLIGDVFRLEVMGVGWGKPGTWWRSDKAISGGAFYDWGAHMVDWLLHLVPQPIDSVTGVFHKLVWRHVTNEDHVQALIRFANGAVADIQLSSIQRIGKPRWLVLGTKGAVVSEERDFRVVTEMKGYQAELRVPHLQSHWQGFYDNLADHLLRGGPLEVTPQSSRRVIAVMEAAELSSKTGKPQGIPHEEEGLYL